MTKKVCLLIGHKEIARRKNGLFFVDTVTCGRCGDVSNIGRRWKYGVLREPYYNILHWLQRKSFQIRIAFTSWLERNDPPPF